MGNVKPITPGEAVESFSDMIPDEMISAVNELLSEAGFSKTRRECNISQNDILNRFVSKVLGDISDEDAIAAKRREAYDKHWLDFEGIFRKAGWNVTYDKPGYNESYGSYFTFKIADKGE